MRIKELLQYSSFAIFCFISCTSLKEHQIQLTGNFPKGDDKAFFFIYDPNTPIKIPFNNGKMNVILDSLQEGTYLCSVRYPASGKIIGIDFYLNPKQTRKYHIEPLTPFTLEDLKQFRHPVHYASNRFGLKMIADAADTKLYEQYYRLRQTYRGVTYYHVLDSLYKLSGGPDNLHLLSPAHRVNFDKNYAAFAASCRSLIDKHSDNPVAALIMLNIDETELSHNIDLYKSLLQKMSGRAKKSQYYANAVLKLTKLTTSLKEGDRFTQPTGKTPGGKPSPVNFGDNQFTLVEFWASWCVPCRKQNPKWNAILKKYENSGFKILGVSLDKNQVNWQQAIEKDLLADWLHISDLQDDGFNGKNALTYGIKSIPFNVLVNNKGVIQKMDMRPEEVETFLKQHLE